MRTDTRETKALLSTNFQPCSFGEDEAGNLYVVDITNAIIYQIVDTQALTGIYELLLLD